MAPPGASHPTMPLAKLVRLPEACLFTAGLAATAWDEDGRPTEWSEWTAADLERMAANDAHLRRTGQPAPYINAAHFTEAIPGYVGPLRFVPASPPSAAAPKGRPARIYAEVWAEDWIAEQVLAGRRPWRSVEVTKHAEAADFHGIKGPVLRGLALLNTHPRRKNLDSVAYGEQGLITIFQEPASAGRVYLTTYQERSMPNMEQILAALQALDGDTEKLAMVAEALGLGAPAEEPAVAADPTAEAPVEEEPAAAPPPAMMSELANLRRQNAELAKRLTASEKKAAQTAAADREARMGAFAEQLTEGFGKARADKAMVIVKARLAAIPAVEVYSENGERHDDRIFTEVLEAMGEPTVAPLTRPGAVGKRPAPRTESFAEAQAAVIAEARTNKDAASVLLNPAFRGAVAYLARKRQTAGA